MKSGAGLTTPTPPPSADGPAGNRAAGPADHTLADKLVQARSRAMAPFGTGPPLPPRTAVEGGAGFPAHVVNIADDDTDDEELRQVASPGLGRLE